MSYASDRAYSEKFIPAIKGIVGPLMVEPAPIEEDNFRATDLIILKARDLRIACRVRRPGYFERWPYDFTIRSHRDSGYKTEMTKLVDGFGDWFFYGHEKSGTSEIAQYAVIDLAAWRAHFIRRRYTEFGKENSNRDGTYFFAFDIRKFVGKPRLVVACSFGLNLVQAASSADDAPPEHVTSKVAVSEPPRINGHPYQPSLFGDGS